MATLPRVRTPQNFQYEHSSYVCFLGAARADQASLQDPLPYGRKAGRLWRGNSGTPSVFLASSAGKWIRSLKTSLLVVLLIILIGTLGQRKGKEWSQRSR